MPVPGRPQARPAAGRDRTVVYALIGLLVVVLVLWAIVKAAWLGGLGGLLLLVLILWLLFGT